MGGTEDVVRHHHRWRAPLLVSAFLVILAFGPVADAAGPSRARLAPSTQLGRIGGPFLADVIAATPFHPADARPEVLPTTRRAGWSAMLAQARSHHTATLLLDGRVLVVGGLDRQGAALASAELYDPATATFRSAGRLARPRLGHTATRLPDGSVLLVGGMHRGGTSARAGPKQVVRFDPATETFSPAGETLSARRNHTATLLNDGSVLIIGGSDFPVPSTEIYDPATRRSEPGPPLVAGLRQSHSATTLEDGRILVVNGTLQAARPVPSAEIYDPPRGTFEAIDPPTLGNFSGVATLLADGSVWFSWGDRFDPRSGGWEAMPDAVPRRVAHTATPLADGRILVAGGVATSISVLATTVLLEPGGQVVAGPLLREPRAHHTATALPSGAVLIIGGSSIAALEGTSGAVEPLASVEELSLARLVAGLPTSGSGGLVRPEAGAMRRFAFVGLALGAVLGAAAGYWTRHPRASR